MSAPDATQVALATLAGIGHLSPRQLRDLLDEAGGDPVAALASFEGRSASPSAGPGLRADESWPRAAVVARLLAERATRVLRAGDDDYPIDVDLPDRPEVLLVEGHRMDALAAPRVAVVGTRAATPMGLDDARELGAVLAGAGITVVSGLAIGIDAAVHEGALAAGGAVVGVVATGLDVVYPRRHTDLFTRVRQGGVICSEHGFGIPPSRWRFPVRNRIIAALADAVVVVEATVRGGTLITARHAADYGRPVYAYPGSRRNAAAAGCNRLIADGALVVNDPDDVVIGVGLTPGAAHARPAPEPATPDQRAVLAALAGEPATLGELAARCRMGAAQTALAVSALERARAVTRARGLVWPVAAPPHAARST